MKILLALLVGIAAGYSFGFKDAKAHDDDVVTRVIATVGGSSREHVRNDIDKQMDALERR
jgi:hypothetical protein